MREGERVSEQERYVGFERHVLEIADVHTSELLPHLGDLVAFADRDKSATLYVHCTMGRSRCLPRYHCSA